MSGWMNALCVAFSAMEAALMALLYREMRGIARKISEESATAGEKRPLIGRKRHSARPVDRSRAWLDARSGRKAG